jgi:hypothetical protein
VSNWCPCHWSNCGCDDVLRERHEKDHTLRDVREDADRWRADSSGVQLLELPPPEAARECEGTEAVSEEAQATGAKCPNCGFVVGSGEPGRV